MMKKNQLLVTLFFFLLSGPIMSLSAQTITVDLSTTYQSIRGFGGMSMTDWIPDLNQDQREKAFKNDPGDIGLSILRIKINPDSTLFYRELPTALYAESQGAIVFASPWNVPYGMLDTNVTTRKMLRYDMYGAYAAHLESFNKFMADSGAPLYAISVQNEPDLSNSGWTKWYAREIITFLRNDAPSINNRIIAPESFHFDHTYTDSILNDSVANAHFDIVGGHIYGSGLTDYPLARTKGKEVWMTEHYTESSHSANDWPLALDVATEINNCMKVNFNAYVWWYIRRFYGLITDDGNISKRGYAMAQFSKFIRPGAVRVDAAVTSASNVDASAYKTDTTLVIVVVNRNTSNVNLSFTIQNGTIDSLSQYTTSATKNVHDDGNIPVSAGTFNATVDASSVTTFATYTTNAGKAGNVPPVANAGPDQALVDSNNDGVEPVTLDGSASYDPDGQITNFSWSENGTQVSADTIYTADVPIGDHVFVLTVTDNDGAVQSDTVNITVASLNHEEFWFEAECGEIGGSNWLTLTDPNASNGRYVTVTPGIQSLTAPTPDSVNAILFPFHVTEAGVFKVWGRVITPTPNDDSFWMRMDDSAWVNWNSIPNASTWHWDDVHDQVPTNNLSYQLDTGNHVLHVYYREDGAKLDKIYITNTGKVPSGPGGAALDSCPVVDTTTKTSEIMNTDIATISVFPNPAHNELHINWNASFNTLAIIDLEGRKVIQKKYNTLMRNTDLSIDLAPGIYFLQLSNKTSSGVIKLLIE